MTKNKKIDTAKIIKAAFLLAEKKPWAEVKFGEIAKALKISHAELRRVAANKNEILKLYSAELNAAMQKQFTKKPQGSLYDRLFAVIMARFDLLQEDRKALLSILEDKAALVDHFPLLCDVGAQMAELAAKGDGMQPILKAVLPVLYAYLLHVWRKDKSADMAKTMAALDKRLRQAEKLYEWFSFKTDRSRR